ncbi:hypothetical protein H9P43_002532 [Blastocladiella emersonii ATCC 22665]|nr:hypothetical protein H9P43_002532 [Blastocladiella emersonii ATCC 22665]
MPHRRAARPGEPLPPSPVSPLSPALCPLLLDAACHDASTTPPPPQSPCIAPPESQTQQPPLTLAQAMRDALSPRPEHLAPPCAPAAETALLLLPHAPGAARSRRDAVSIDIEVAEEAGAAQQQQQQQQCLPSPPPTTPPSPSLHRRHHHVPPAAHGERDDVDANNDDDKFDRFSLEHNLPTPPPPSPPAHSASSSGKGGGSPRSRLAAFTAPCRSASLRAQLAALVAFALCIGAATLIFQELRAAMSPAEVRLSCNSLASGVALVINREIVSKLHGLDAFASSARPMSNATFAQYLDTATVNSTLLTSIVIFQGIPEQQRSAWETASNTTIFDLVNGQSVPSARRETYWPGTLTYVARNVNPENPTLVASAPFGFDPQSNPERAATIALALADGIPHLSPVIYFITGGAGISIWLRAGGPVAFPNGLSNSALVGMSFFASEVIKRSMLEPSMGYHIVDATDGRVVWTNLSGAEATDLAAVSSVRPADRTWTVVCAPLPKYSLAVYKYWSHVVLALVALLAPPVAALALATVHKLDEAGDVKRQRFEFDRRLAALRERASACIQAVPDYLVALDRDGKLLACNANATALFTRPEARDRVRTVIEDCGPLSPPVEGTAGPAAAAAARAVTIKRPDGTSFAADLLVCTPSDPRDGAAASGIAQVLLFADATEKRRAEAQIAALARASKRAFAEQQSLLRLWCAHLADPAARLLAHIEARRPCDLPAVIVVDDAEWRGAWAAAEHLATLAADVRYLFHGVAPPPPEGAVEPVRDQVCRVAEVRARARWSAGARLRLDVDVGLELAALAPTPDLARLLARIVDVVHESALRGREPARISLAQRDDWLDVRAVFPTALPVFDDDGEEADALIPTPRDLDVATLLDPTNAARGAEFTSPFALDVVDRLVADLAGRVAPRRPGRVRFAVPACGLLVAAASPVPMPRALVTPAPAPAALEMDGGVTVLDASFNDAPPPVVGAEPVPVPASTSTPATAAAAEQPPSSTSMALITTTPQPQPQPQPQPAQLPQLDPQAESRPRPRVMVVEDNRVVRTVTSKRLDLLRCDVVQMPGGAEAVAYFSEVFQGDAPTVDLVLMDLQMPEMDGVTAALLIHAVAEAAKRAVPPIVAYTADSVHERRNEVMATGCFADFAPKSAGPERTVLRDLLAKHVPDLLG